MGTLLSSRLFVLILSGLLIGFGTQPLGAQVATHYLAGLAAAEGTELGLAILNSAETEAQVTLTARTYDGLPIAGTGMVNPYTLTIAGFGKMELRLVDLFGDGISLQHGWLEINSSTSAIKVYSFVFDGMLTFLEGVDVTSAASNQFIFPKVSTDSSTKLHVVNTLRIPVEVTISLYDNTGTISSTIPVLLPGQSGISRTSGELAPGNASFEGYAVVQSVGSAPFAPQALVGFETYRNQSDIAAVRGIPGGDALQTGRWSHFVSQGGYTSRLMLINTTETPQLLQISVATAAGMLSVSKTLMPHQRIEKDVAEMFGLSGQSVTAGDVQFATQTDTPAVVGALEYATADGRSFSAAEHQGQPQPDFY